MAKIIDNYVYVKGLSKKLFNSVYVFCIRAKVFVHARFVVRLFWESARKVLEL